MSAARFNDSEIAWATESSTSSAAKTSIISGCEIVTWFELEDSGSGSGSASGSGSGSGPGLGSESAPGSGFG